MRSFSFNKDGTFKIVQFTDIHWDTDAVPENNLKTVQLIKLIIELEKPDFIAITGDTVYQTENNSDLPLALSPILESNIPWAPVFGNHDDEEGCSKEVLFQTMSSMPNCCISQPDESVSGVGNYAVSVRSTVGREVWRMYFLDSHAYNSNEKVGGYDFIKTDQISWYLKNSTRSPKKAFGELAFFHVPLSEYAQVWEEEVCYGNKIDGIDAPRQNSGMFSAMLQSGRMRGVFVGHDHLNDFYGELYGIRLCYGRATGYNGYGCDNYQRGARVIELNENNTETFQSWLRLADGDIVCQQKEHIPQEV